MVFEAGVSRGRVVLLLAGALLFVAAGIWFVYDPEAISAGSRFLRDPGLVELLGWGAIAFFGLCAAVAVRQLFRTGVVMRIAPEGLYWRRWSEETIPWSAFDSAAYATIRSQRMLTLWLRDPDAYPSSTLLGRLAGANKALGFGDVTLTAQGLSQGFDAMAGAVEANAPELFTEG
ncbi:STM3941 family protein [Sphingomonas canadensis]|uniref:STM3941 family protein n=1 Tax=Sphingomonas canadensis TaxID=1219257 RepID=A0ABW3H803_9SPHN|nr:STM3941 family protein [Sphingomonas canadensis]MCW3837147.1 hypothetical protein [Sphingomonas canadensis]